LRQLVELLLAVVIIAGCQNRCLSLSPGNQCCRRRNDMNCRWVANQLVHSARHARMVRYTS
jgi:hypothetical protein